MRLYSTATSVSVALPQMFLQRLLYRQQARFSQPVRRSLPCCRILQPQRASYHTLTKNSPALPESHPVQKILHPCRTLDQLRHLKQNKDCHTRRALPVARGACGGRGVWFLGERKRKRERERGAHATGQGAPSPMKYTLLYEFYKFFKNCSQLICSCIKTNWLAAIFR